MPKIIDIGLFNGRTLIQWRIQRGKSERKKGHQKFWETHENFFREMQKFFRETPKKGRSKISAKIWLPRF